MIRAPTMTVGRALGLVAATLLLSSGIAAAADPASPSSTTEPPSSMPDRAVAQPSNAAIPPARNVEVGGNFGVVSRPAENATVEYSPGMTYGAFARVDILPWLSGRVSARMETGTASPRGGSLGVPGAHFPDADLVRPYLSVSAEPTWSPVERLSLWLGVGVGWGRTACPSLHAIDANADNVLVPRRAGVFVDFPLSVGARYEVIRNWLVLQASGSVSVLTSQSGSLFKPIRVPDQNGQLATVSAFPELGTSFTLLAGVGVLL